MDLFARLQQLARTQAQSLAYVTPERVVTYRRLWSRIERASARLQGEWRLRPGQRVIYCGNANPDALVLYLALARGGACLVPLEGEMTCHAATVARTLDVPLMLWDESGAAPAGGPACLPLADLIRLPCPQQAFHTEPDPGQASLERVEAVRDGQVYSRAFTLAELLAAAPPLPPAAARIGEYLFDPAIFGPVVLPALWAGMPLSYPAMNRNAHGFAVK